MCFCLCLVIPYPFAGSDSTQGRTLLRSQFDGKSNLFYVQLPEGTTLSYAVDDKEKFPVQFGREVCHTKNCFIVISCFFIRLVVSWESMFTVSEIPPQINLDFLFTLSTASKVKINQQLVVHWKLHYVDAYPFTWDYELVGGLITRNCHELPCFYHKLPWSFLLLWELSQTITHFSIKYLPSVKC